MARNEVHERPKMYRDLTDAEALRAAILMLEGIARHSFELDADAIRTLALGELQRQALRVGLADRS